MPHGISLAVQYQQKRSSIIKEQRRRINKVSKIRKDEEDVAACKDDGDDHVKKSIEHVTNGKRIVPQHHAIHIRSTHTKSYDKQCDERNLEQTIEVVMKGNKQSSTPSTAKSTMISPNSDTSKYYALRRIVGRSDKDIENCNNDEEYSYYSYDNANDEISSSTSSSSTAIPLVRPIAIRPQISFPIVFHENGPSEADHQSDNEEKNETTLRNVMQSLFENELKCNDGDTSNNIFLCGCKESVTDERNHVTADTEYALNSDTPDESDDEPPPMEEITIVQKQSSEYSFFISSVRQCCSHQHGFGCCKQSNEHIHNNKQLKPNKITTSSTTKINNDIVFCNDNEIEITTSTLPKPNQENHMQMEIYSHASSSSLSCCYMSKVHSPLPISPPLSQTNIPHYSSRIHKNAVFQMNNRFIFHKHEQQSNVQHDKSKHITVMSSSSKLKYRSESLWKPFDRPYDSSVINPDYSRDQRLCHISLQRSSSSSTNSSDRSNNCLLPVFVSPAYKFRHIAHSLDSNDDDSISINMETTINHSDHNTDNKQHPSEVNTHEQHSNSSKQHQANMFQNLKKDITLKQQLEQNNSTHCQQYNHQRSSSAELPASPILFTCQEFSICNIPSLISKCFCDWSSGL